MEFPKNALGRNTPVIACFDTRPIENGSLLLWRCHAKKIGLDGAELITIVNLKADPLLLDALRKEPGFFAAYHMSKTHWISVALDGSVENDKIKMLLALSYDMTAPKIKAKK